MLCGATGTRMDPYLDALRTGLGPSMVRRWPKRTAGMPGGAETRLRVALV